MNKTKVKINTPIYLGMSILKISKIVMYGFQYDYIKAKYQDKANLCYLDTGSFTVNIKTKYVCKDIAHDVEKRFDTSNYDIDSPLPMGKNTKIVGLMQHESGGKIMTEFVWLRPKIYYYRIYNGSGTEKTKRTKNCIIK